MLIESQWQEVGFDWTIPMHSISWKFLRKTDVEGSLIDQSFNDQLILTSSFAFHLSALEFWRLKANVFTCHSFVKIHLSLPGKILVTSCYQLQKTSSKPEDVMQYFSLNVHAFLTIHNVSVSFLLLLHFCIPSNHSILLDTFLSIKSICSNLE